MKVSQKVILICFLSFTINNYSQETNKESISKIGLDFPSFNLKDFKGVSFSQDVFKSNKITIVDFWGTWCGPCRRAMPELQALYSKYNKQGLNIIGISVQDKPNKPKEFVDSKGFTYQFLENGDELLKKLNIVTLPTIILVDNVGKIILIEKGLRKGSIENIEKIIQKAIQ